MVKFRTKVMPRAQLVLLLALTLLLAIPGIAHADATIDSVKTQDLNPVDGHLDSLAVTLSSAVDSVSASDFIVSDGYTVTAASVAGTIVNLTLAPKASFDTGATPTVTYNGSSQTASDNAPPVLVKAVGRDAGSVGEFNAVGDMLKFVFSEPISLFNNINNAQFIPAQTPADKHLALEQAIVIGPNNPGVGCNGDGDGTPNGGSNFPAVSTTPTNPTAPQDPIEPATFASTANPSQGAFNTTEITVTEHTDNTNSTKSFSVVPSWANPTCSASISATNPKNIQDASPSHLSAIVPGSGAPKLTHIRPELKSPPVTAGTGAHLGQIDRVTVEFEHPVDDRNLATLNLNRFTISTTVDGVTEAATGLSLPASGAVINGKLNVNFVPPADWNTGTKPNVTYNADSGNCLTDGVLVKTNFKTNVGWLYYDCADDFNVDATDAAAPVLLGAKTLDADTNGKLDGVQLQFSEDMQAGSLGNGAGFALANPAYTPSGAVTASGDDDSVVNVTFSETAGPEGDTANAPTVAYSPGSVKDSAGNLLAAINPTQTVDAAGPVLMAGNVYDLYNGTTANAHDGKIDEALFSFSEPVKDASLNPAAFHIAGSTANSFVADPLNTDDAGTADDRDVTVRVTNGVPGTDAKDLRVDAGAVTDLAPQVVDAPASELGASSVADKAAPVVLSVSPAGQSTSAVTSAITFSEPMDDQNSAMSVSFEGTAGQITITPDVSEGHNNGFRSGNTAVWDGIAPAPDADACDAVLGCAYPLTISGGKEADGSLTQAPATGFTWTIDNIAPGIPTVGSPADGTRYTTRGDSANVVFSGTSGETNLTIKIKEGDTVIAQATSGSNAGHTWSVTVPLGLGSHSFAALAMDAGGNESTVSPVRTIQVLSGPRFKALPATRIYGTGAPVLKAGSDRDIKVVGVGGVPSTNVDAVVVNVEVQNPTQAGYIRVTPTGSSSQTAVQEFRRGQTISNLVTVKVGNGGNIRLHLSAGQANVFADVEGFYTSTTTGTGSLFKALPAARAYGTGAPALSSSSDRVIPVAGVAGVPSDGADAVLVNVEVSKPTKAGYIRVTPSNASSQTAVQEFAAGQTISNLVAAKLGPDGAIKLHLSAGQAYVFVDVEGYFADESDSTGSTFQPLAATRLYGTGAPALSASSARDIKVVGLAGIPSTGVDAVLVNVEVADPSQAGYIRVTPTGSPSQTAVQEFGPHQSISNLVAVKVGSDGKINLKLSAGSAYVFVDIAGYYTSA